ncbi:MULTISPECIES: hypothetical protein [unclassified Coleofasciculus]|nr:MULTISPECIES: hypothetical protein [unclassified Coleofasciculus]
MLSEEITVGKQKISMLLEEIHACDRLLRKNRIENSTRVQALCPC